MILRILLTAFAAALASLVAAPAHADDGLTARQILERFARTQGGLVHVRATESTRIEYDFVEGGNHILETVIAKAPNRVLAEVHYLALKYTSQPYTYYAGFDGRTAWRRSTDGDYGVEDPASTRAVISQAALDNSAELVSGRWPTAMARGSDEVINGRSYFVLHATPAGGDTIDMIIDQGTYDLAGTRNPAQHSTFFCTKYLTTASQERVCQSGMATNLYGEHYQVTTTRTGENFEVGDDQFAPPQEEQDATTTALLKNYAFAMGGEAAIASQHSRTITGTSARNARFGLRVITAPPFDFSYQYATTSGTTKMVYDGAHSVGIGTTGIARWLADDALQMHAMGYNACELRLALCAVRVNRGANVRLGQETFYSLHVSSIADATKWYTVLLDQRTYLPRLLKLGSDRLLLSDYRRLPSGMQYPATWLFNSPDFNLDITHASADENHAMQRDFIIPSPTPSATPR